MYRQDIMAVGACRVLFRALKGLLCITPLKRVVYFSVLSAFVTSALRPSVTFLFPPTQQRSVSLSPFSSRLEPGGKFASLTQTEKPVLWIVSTRSCVFAPLDAQPKSPSLIRHRARPSARRISVSLPPFRLGCDGTRESDVTTPILPLAEPRRRRGTLGSCSYLFRLAFHSVRRVA